MCWILRADGTFRKRFGPYHVDGLEEAVFAVLVDFGLYVIFTGTTIDVH